MAYDKITLFNALVYYFLPKNIHAFPIRVNRSEKEYLSPLPFSLDASDVIRHPGKMRKVSNGVRGRRGGGGGTGETAR